jgi:hypothetical protein
MVERTDQVWKSQSLAATYLEGVRAAIPLALEQIDVMLRLIAAGVVAHFVLADYGVPSWTEAVAEWSPYDAIDSLRRHHPDQSRDEVARHYYDRPDRSANIVTPVERQCAWLREIGFTDVDCYLKVFEMAVFGGRRP